VLPTQAYLQITGIYDLRGGAALSFLVLIPSLIVFLLQRYWVGQRSYVTVTGKQGGGSSMDRVPALVRLILQIISLTILGFVVFLYGIIFFGSFVEVWGANHAFTLKHFQYIFRFGRKSITDTLTIALWAMLIGGLYSVIIGYLIGKQEFFGRKTMEFVSMLNYALPGTVVGIAYLLAFNDPPIMITGTATILVALYIFRYSPAGVRTTVASLQQIDSSIEEASTSLGADRQVTFRKITLPLILPAFFASIEVVFIRAMTAISAAIFLVSFDWTLVTVRILESITELELGSASAFSVFIIVLVYLVVNAIKGLTAILGLRGIKR
jgi:iron(III) transport system permease protein